MTTLTTTSSIRNTLITIATVIAMCVPLLASASIAKNDVSVAYDPSELLSASGQAHLYDRLKSASRKICGSSSLRLAGSLSNSRENAQCYNDTLTSAVERLDVIEITAIHSD